jgi:hypothetical protein
MYKARYGGAILWLTKKQGLGPDPYQWPTGLHPRIELMARNMHGDHPALTVLGNSGSPSSIDTLPYEDR